MIRAIALASLVGFVSQAAIGQTEPVTLAFEVATIKLNRSEGQKGGLRAQASNLTGENVTLKQLMAFAYQLSGPDWIETEGYDVAAMAKNSPSPAQLRMMLRTLLEVRFKLKTHRETKEIPVYWLVVAKGGPKLRDAKEEAAFNSTLAGKSPFRPGFEAIFSNKSLPEFAERLGRPMDRPVLDKTGIKGRYWFQLEWSNERDQTRRAPDLPVGPALLSALQEQLGLNLEEGNAPIEVTLIDSAEKPSEN